jgi:two-component system response regulator MprA
MRVLVVDDDPAVRGALNRALRLEGYEVSVASDGPPALEEIAIRPPDAVILDIGLPTADGLDVCRRLRAADNDTPVLMLTARDAINDRVQGLDAGADDYLVKPFALAHSSGAGPRSRERSSALPTSASTLSPERPAVVIDSSA